jgi:hypothetical protein
VALRDKMRASAQQYLAPGEEIQQVIGAQTASQYVAALGSVFVFLGLNRYRILAVTSQRILVLDAGKMSMAKAKGVVAEVPRTTPLGQGTGVWHVLPLNGEKLRIHRRFYKDMAAADSAVAAR